MTPSVVAKTISTIIILQKKFENYSLQIGHSFHQATQNTIAARFLKIGASPAHLALGVGSDIVFICWNQFKIFLTPF